MKQHLLLSPIHYEYLSQSTANSVRTSYSAFIFLEISRLIKRSAVFRSSDVLTYEKELVGTVFGWSDYPEYPDILVVKAAIVDEPYRRNGIGTRLLKDFEEAAEREGFRSIVLGAEWEAIPFYISYGLECFANIQITLDKIPWNTMSELKSKYNVAGTTVFGPSIK
jgi:GNAT superfamily N-acetyltransferase